MKGDLTINALVGKKGELGEDTLSTSRGAHLCFTCDWARQLNL